MKRVLLPIDGSECALRGVALVISKRSHYANPDELDIHLVNVQAPFSQDVSRFASHDQIAEFHREESEKLMLGARELLDAANVKYTCHHMVGKVAETITNLADSIQCDQIVMGTHGRGAFTDFLMGSITLKVVNLSRIPVLLVK
jgi:nucleotide-binding universal stress UspA family protein